MEAHLLYDDWMSFQINRTFQKTEMYCKVMYCKKVCTSEYSQNIFLSVLRLPSPQKLQ